jgi:hypothetical protein
MAWSSSPIASVAGNDTFATGAIDTTGANFSVIAFAGTLGAAVSDSKSNTWTRAVFNNAFAVVEIWYAYNTSLVGSGHTFTLTGTDFFGAAAVFAFSGGDTADPLDQTNNSQSFGVTTLATGSVTPSTANQLVFAAVQGDNGGVPTINSGFSTVVGNAGSGGTYVGNGGAFIIQGAAAAVNPTWTLPATANASAAIASFKAGAGGGGFTRFILGTH